MTAPVVRFRRLRPDAVVPAYMTADAAGLDLAAALDAPVVLAAGARVTVGTGLALELPRGFEGQVRPRSGLARQHGVTVLNAPGTIDADYRGEVAVVLVNHGAEPLTITAGMRVAQLVIAPVVQATLEVVDALSPTGRGTGGFGSTGA
ncbi:MAG: dUTP diphosphatase [Myxococcales bacterium]|nr:dUTP diphosphatase [Myxococcales bacterium]